MKHYTRENNHNEVKTIMALNSEEVKALANDGNEEVLTIKETIAIQEKEEQERMEEMAQLEEENSECEKYLRELDGKIETILAKGNGITLEDCGKVSSILDTYSDVYKDVNGIRPHWYMEMVWCRIKSIVPEIVAQCDKMVEDGTWWNFVDKA